MSSAYGFTEDTARRIARVVKAVEGDTTEPTRIGPMLGGSTMSLVRVTSLGSPLSTGQRVDYHASATTMNDINEVKIKEMNGATLTVGARYTGIFSGYSYDGKPVFVVREWSTVSIVELTSIGSPLSTGKRMDYSATTNSFSDTGEVKIKEIKGQPLTVSTRYIGQLSGYDSYGTPVFIVKAIPGSGSAVIDVVTDVTCGPAGLSLSTVTISGADYDNAVIRNFLALNDVTSKSYTANQGRAVVVNGDATGLTFGAKTDGTSTAFLVNDVTSPGNYYAYSTNSSGVKGWNLQAATPAGLTVGGSVVVSSRKAAVSDVAAHTISSVDLATTASTTQTAINDLKTQLNLLLERIRSHGLIS